MVFCDPYFLDFLGLSGQHVVKDVEDAILWELQAFILELGSDFAFTYRRTTSFLFKCSSRQIGGLAILVCYRNPTDVKKHC